jgi:GNAT superfamily N-acetyltransferase
MDLLIVALTPAQLPALRQLYLDARTAAFPWADPARFRLQDFDTVTAQELVAVALHHTTPVGFVAWWPPDDFIHSLFVQPALLGQGIGRSLLNHCLQQIGRPATLKCLRANTVALRFYAGQNWQVVGSGASEEGEYLLLAYLS